MMNQPVHPIKIGIVYNKQQWKSHKKIQPAILLYICVKKCCFSNCRYMQYKKGYQCKYADGDDRIEDFPDIVTEFWCTLLNFFIENLFAKQYIKQHKKNSCHYKIAATDIF